MSGSTLTRIPQNIEQADRIFGGRTFLDILVFVGIPISLVSLLLFFNLVSGRIFIILLAAVLMVDMALLKAIPPEHSVTRWIRATKNYLTLDKTMRKYETDELSHDVDLSSEDESYTPRDPEDPGLFERFETPTRTTELTQIDAVYPNADILQLDDGSMIGAVTVDGRELLLEDATTRQNAIKEYQAFLTTLEFPIEHRKTSREFDIDAHIEHMKGRLEHTDIQSRPILSSVIKEKINFWDTYVRSLGMNNRRDYIIVRVSPQDIGLGLGDNTPFDLSGIIEPDSPVGQYLNKFSSSTENPETQLYKELSQRLNTLQSGLNSLDGVKPDIVSYKELTLLHQHFWNRQTMADTEWVPANDGQIADVTTTNASL